MNLLKKTYNGIKVNKQLKKFCNDLNFNSSKPSLSSLITKFNAFDNREGTDKDTIHSYVKIYEKVFASKREAARNVLEIGIYSGAFLKILSEYFENAHIYGIDIDLSNIRFGKDDPRINIYEMDGTDPNSAKKLDVEYFDLIIEDGSHLPDEQVVTFNNYAPLINRNGIYIIEDINSSELNTLSPRLQHIAKANNMDLEIFDLRYIKERYDNICMIAIKK